MKTWWRQSVETYADPKIATILVFGFASGLPIMLVAGTLSTWLREAEVSRAAIGLFAFVFAPYTFKFAWAPLIDKLRLPVLHALLGRRRSWILVAQIGLIGSIFALGQTDPATDLATVALAAVLVAFFSASQDVAIDAYRVESLPIERLGAGAGVVVLGYRVGMFVATWGALRLADVSGWSAAYTAMAGCVLIGVLGVVFAKEPPPPPSSKLPPKPGFRAWFQDAVVAPFTDFLERYGIKVALAILALISVFKASDVLLTLMANPFYIDVGFTKAQIADVTKLFGVWMTIAGGLIGGVVVFRFGLLQSMFIAAVLMAGSNGMFAFLAVTGPAMPAFIATIAIENLSSGIGTAVLVAFLSALCNVEYTAVQYALLTSFMQMFGKFFIVPLSGFYADATGWFWFFVTSTTFAIPALMLLFWLVRHGPVLIAPRPDAAAEPVQA